MRSYQTTRVFENQILHVMFKGHYTSYAHSQKLIRMEVYKRMWFTLPDKSDSFDRAQASMRPRPAYTTRLRVFV